MDFCKIKSNLSYYADIKDKLKFFGLCDLVHEEAQQNPNVFPMDFGLCVITALKYFNMAVE